jgi:hypothetical protein
VTAVLLGQRLLVANVGDSRAVLSRGGKGAQQALECCAVLALPPPPSLLGPLP